MAPDQRTRKEPLDQIESTAEQARTATPAEPKNALQGAIGAILGILKGGSKQVPS
ncbi:MAG: hypothetical protein HPY76_08200 [Anaerolineae bacterium]|nr:hypothetical protein [Anaerolineae bacterium]